MAGLRSCPPPAATTVQRWVLADPAELRLFRASLRQTLDAQSPMSAAELDDIAERMAIVATELATNAMRHAGSPAVIELGRTKTAFVLDVADDQPLSVPEIASDHSPQAGGRGLKITQELALDTGWYVAGTRKHVWARFTVPRHRRFQAPRILVRDLDRLVRLLRRVHH